MLYKLKIDPHHHSNEAVFIKSFKAGDPGAFECIYRQMFQPLTQSARAIIASEIDAEDIAAGAFLKLYTHGRRQITTLEHIKRWMFIVIRNDSFNYLLRRSKERVIRRDLAYNDYLIQDIHPEKSEPLLQRHAMRELENLPKQARTVLQLYYFGEKSTRQIAALMHINGQTVLNHKNKGLKSLRRRIATNQPLK